MFCGATAFNQSVEWMFAHFDAHRDNDVSEQLSLKRIFQHAFALHDSPHFSALESRQYPWIWNMMSPYDFFVAATFNHKFPRHAMVIRKLLNRLNVEHSALQFEYVVQTCKEHGVKLRPKSFPVRHRSRTNWLFLKLDVPSCPERYILSMVVQPKKSTTVCKILNAPEWSKNCEPWQNVFDRCTYEQLYCAAVAKS